MKKLLTVLFVLISLIAKAQPSPTSSQVRFPAVWVQFRDTATARPSDTACIFYFNNNFWVRRNSSSFFQNLLDGSGTVTSIATNNGTGITGGTITTTGTLAIDTSSTISTKDNVLNQLNKYAGTTNTTTLGAITTGVWNGTAIANAYLANSSITVNAGTGLSGGGLVSLGGGITLNNAGVTSISGTDNQITASASIGGVTLSIPTAFIAPGYIKATSNLIAKQNTNSATGVALYLKRDTDTGPLGYIIQSQNAAATANLFTVDVNGAVSGASYTGNLINTLTFGAGLNAGSYNNSAAATVSIATGGVTNAMLANSTISGTALGGTLPSLTIGTGLSGTSYNGSAAVTIANTGVLSNVAGTGITVSGATGNVTITNAGVTSITGTANQITASASTGGVTLSIPTAFIAPGSVTASSNLAATENTNSATGVALYLKRNTDTGPLGFLIQGQNTAGTLNLFTVDVNGAVSGASYTGNLVNALTFGAGLNAGTFNNSAASTVSIATGGVTNAMLANSTISGTALGGTLPSLTFGTYLTGGSYNGTGAATLETNATSLNTASTLVARDASGNFAAGTITAALSGNATTATTLQTARLINGVSFNGSADITIAASTTAALTMSNSGAGAVSGTTFNGGTAQTISYNTIGAPSTTGTNASGTWGINITGTAAGETLATVTGRGSSTTTAVTFNGGHTSISAALSGVQPSPVATNGTDATSILNATGGKGGNTTGTTGQIAGAGSLVSLVAGAGGDAPAGSTNGNGGNVVIQSGVAGSGLGTSGSAGTISLNIGGTTALGIAANQAVTLSGALSGTTAIFGGGPANIYFSPILSTSQSTNSTISSNVNNPFNGASARAFFSVSTFGNSWYWGMGSSTSTYGNNWVLSDDMSANNTPSIIVSTGTGNVSLKGALQVGGSNTSTATIGDAGITASAGSVVLRTGSTKYAFLLGAQNNVNDAFEITASTAAGGIIFNTPIATFLRSGNIGIGTTDPGSYKTKIVGGRLYVETSNENYSIGISRAGANAYYLGITNSLTPDLLFSNNAGTETMRLTDAGRLLVGTTTDDGSSRVQVNGSVALFGGSLLVPNTFGVNFRNAGNTAYRSGITLDGSNNIVIGADIDINTVRVGTSAATSALSIANSGAATFSSSVTATTYAEKVVSVSTTYTVASDVGTVYASSDTYTITLPSAIGNTGRTITIKRTSNTLGTVITISGVTLGSSENGGSLPCHAAAVYRSNGTAWYCISYHAGGCN